MSRTHGQTIYYIEGEGFVGNQSVSEVAQEDGGGLLGGGDAADGGVLSGAVVEAAPVPETPLDTERAFRFSRMFKALPRFRPPAEGLIALGKAMDDTPNLKDHPTLPAGFTYLGQFIDHDITFDKTQGLPTGALEPEEIIQGRSPSLDLDSVYGRGPEAEEKPIYADDTIHLRVGSCSPVSSPDSPEGQNLPNDLPRGHNAENPLEATIGDPRNDENLAVAQIHLSFVKFHNAVVDRLAAEGLSGAELFARARETVVLHYQWIILHDFLPRVIEPGVLDEVRSQGRTFFTDAAGEEPSMPIEFSVAAYRFGHSMIRDAYSWNRNFPSANGGPAGTLEFLFKFSGVSGSRTGDSSDPPMFGLPTLPANWPVDWRRLFEVGGEPPAFNHTRSIDTALALPLRELPEFLRQNAEAGLAVRNLLRGRLLGLPTGQHVAETIGAPTLTQQQLRDGTHGAVLQQHGFDTQTPLWYYILREAEVFHNGERLGPVGSRLLAETFVGLVEGSSTSVLASKYQRWTPTLPGQGPTTFTMADLLLLVNDLNPLGAEHGSSPVNPGPVDPPSPVDPPLPVEEPFFHSVQEGETLRSIAARFLGDESRWHEIRDANRDKISDPDLIHPGTELLIPGGSTPLPPLIHVVEANETLRSIAARFLGDESRWREIRDANRNKISDPDLIHPGLELLIPRG